ncbi:hypothetical protein [Isoptericola sp. NPDC056605]|uniref:Gp37-like protein n=1 Tax=Isoptericola sp. NPDC056605 TaxID=3345876 RepID=UPI0036C498C1
MLRPRLVLSVYDKDLAYRGLVSKPAEVSATARDYALAFESGTATVSVATGDEINEDLQADGSHLVIQYRPDPGEDPHRLIHHVGGRIVDRGGDRWTQTYTVVDDDSVLSTLLGRPVPGASLATGQGAGAFTVTGPAETVIKSVVTANLATTDRPLVVAPDLGRGDPLTASLRMQALTDALPGLPFSMLSVFVRQIDGELVLDARTPVEHTVPLTERSGVVQGTWGTKAPDFTRVMVAGGEVSGVTKYREVINEAAEALHGDCGWSPAVVMATDTTDDAVMDAKGWEALNAAAQKASLQVEFKETDDWRYGVTFEKGDVFPIQMHGAPLLTDRVREVEITWAKGSGLTVTARIGEHSDKPNQELAAAITQVARAVRVDRAGRV